MQTLAKLAVGLGLAVASWTGSAMAREAWTVVSMDGRVMISENKIFRTLRPGGSVAVGKWLKTDTGARITLRRGGSTISLEPRTLVAVAGLEGDPEATVFAQRWGASKLDIEKRERPHFRIKTPYLAAVVKGPTLSVTADRVQSTIRVDKGWVAMTDEARGLACEAWTGVSVSSGLGRRRPMRAWGEGRWTKPVKTTAYTPWLAPLARKRPVGPDTIDPSGTTIVAPASEGYAG